MSVSKWAYTPEVCDGGGCPGDCDLCDKPKNMEDDLSDFCDFTKLNDYIKRRDAFIILEKTWVDGTEYMGNLFADFENIHAADVVEADKAQKEIDYWHDKAQSYEQTILKLSLNKADVVEVVRCNDCKHYNEYENGEKIIGEEEVHDGWCMRWSGIENVNRHDYCSYGERKEV